jgi:hypothetical protein
LGTVHYRKDHFYITSNIYDFFNIEVKERRPMDDAYMMLGSSHPSAYCSVLFKLSGQNYAGGGKSLY